MIFFDACFLWFSLSIGKGHSFSFSSSFFLSLVTFQVPIAMFGGSGNYASALYLAAVKANALDKVESELYDLVEASKKSPTFFQFTKDLSVPSDTRVKAISEISAQAKFTDVTKNFLGRIIAHS